LGPSANFASRAPGELEQSARLLRVPHFLTEPAGGLTFDQSPADE